MSWAQNEIIQILLFLTPGLVSLVIFYSLVSRPKPSEFERIIYALIFTLFAQGLVAVSQSLQNSWNIDFNVLELSENKYDLVCSLLASVLLGVFTAIITNADVIHRLFRWFGVTHESALRSVWYATFATSKCYVVLHLDGQRRLFGWPVEWPTTPQEGEFKISEPEWLIDKEDKNDDYDDDSRRPAKGVDFILVRAADVELVEFLPYITNNRRR